MSNYTKYGQNRRRASSKLDSSPYDEFEHLKSIPSTHSAKPESDSTNNNDDEEARNLKTLCDQYVKRFLPLTQVKEEQRNYFMTIPEIGPLLDRYVKKDLYATPLINIRKSLGGQKLFVSISTACDGLCKEGPAEFVNVSIGALKKNGPGPVYLVNCVEKHSQSKEFYSKLIHDSFRIVWPEKGSMLQALKEILLIINEDEPELMKASQEIKKKYNIPLVNLISVDHRLHAFELHVKSAYKRIGQVVDAVYVLIVENLVFGSMTRAEFCGKLALPKALPLVYNSEDNFIEMAIYLVDNFDRFKQFCTNDKSTVAKELSKLLNETTRKELTAFKRKYSFFVALMQLLRSRPIAPLPITMKSIDSFLTSLEDFPEEKDLADKLWELLCEDLGFMVLHRVSEYTGFFEYAPIVLQDRYRFPRFHFLKQLTEKIPAEHMYINNVVYCYQEEDNFAKDDESMYNESKGANLKFFINNMISEEEDHYNVHNIYS